MSFDADDSERFASIEFSMNKIAKAVDPAIPDIESEFGLYLKRIAFAIERLVSKEWSEQCDRCGCTLIIIVGDDTSCPVCDSEP